MSTTKNGVILNTFLPLCSLSLLELERFLDVLRMTKSFISLTVNCRVDINHPLLTGWREGRSPSAKANYARKFSKSKSSKGEYFPSMVYCQQSGLFTQLKTRLLYFPRLRIQLSSLLLTTRDYLRAARNEGRWPYSSQAITFSSNIKEHVLTEDPAVSIKNSSRNFTGYPSF